MIILLSESCRYFEIYKTLAAMPHTLLIKSCYSPCPLTVGEYILYQCSDYKKAGKILKSAKLNLSLPISALSYFEYKKLMLVCASFSCEKNIIIEEPSLFLTDIEKDEIACLINNIKNRQIIVLETDYTFCKKLKGKLIIAPLKTQKVHYYN